MERNNYIPEDQIARHDAMGNPVAKPWWDRQNQKPSEVFLVSETVDRQIENILEGEFTINPTVDGEIKEILEKANF